MKGYKRFAGADINDLRSILRDQYKSAYILKEFTQNADDAGATELHLAWRPGEPSATNPLLRADGILVLNDGAFLDENAGAIDCLHIGSKGGDRAAIGKFGLGMKSVYHLCEAFFYAMSPNQPAATAGHEPVTLLNPWTDTGLHDNWADTPETRSFIAEALGRWAHGCDRWFCVWIPLRHSDHLDGKAPIKNRLPSPDEILGGDLVASFATMLPLLRSLRKVALWEPSSGAFECRTTLEIDTGASRRCYPDISEQERRAIFGRIGGTGSSSPRASFDFIGYEAQSDDSRLHAYRLDARWPVYATFDSSTGALVDVPDKSLPHSAVAILRGARRGGSARLSIRRAVFLPLAEDLESHPLVTENDVDVILHGCFFLDSGRSDVVAETNDDLRLERDWNRRLEDVGTLPLLLPSLADAVRRLEIPVVEVREVTRALASSSFLSSRREAVCRHDQWVYRVSSLGGVWSLLPASDAVYEIPNPGPHEALPFQVLPNLTVLAAEQIVTYSGVPKLSAQEPAAWATDRRWLDGLSVESVFASPDHLAWFASLVASGRESIREETWPTVVQLVRAALEAKSLKELDSMRAGFRRLVATLPAGMCVTIPTPLGSLARAQEALREISASLPHLAIVPESLAPDGASEWRLPSGAVNPCLAALASLADAEGERKVPAATVSELALHFLECANGTSEEKRQRYGKLCLFRVRDVREGTEVLKSWNDLNQLRQRGFLFSGSPGLAKQLQAALASASFFTLVERQGVGRARAADILFGDVQLRPCDASACQIVLLQTPTLTDPEHRADLLESLAASPIAGDPMGGRRTLRYLLHGTEETREQISQSLYTPDEAQGPLWRRIGEALLATSDQSWRCLAGELSDRLSPNLKQLLGIQVLGPRNVHELLQGVLPERLAALELSRDERYELLASIPGELLTWELPLHESVRGELVAVDGEAFLEGDFRVFDYLANDVTVLRVPEHAALANFYRSTLQTWDPLWSLVALVEREDLGDRSNDILFCLEHLDSGCERLPPKVTGRLASSAWLPTRVGFVAPRAVLNVPELGDQVERIIEKSRLPDYVDVEGIDERVRVHRAFAYIRSLMPSRQETLLLLSTCIGECAEYGIGDFGVLDGDDVVELQEAFGARPPAFLHGVTLLRKASNAGFTTDELAVLCEGMTQDLDEGTIRAILAVLADRLEDATNEKPQASRWAYQAYLRALVDRPRFAAEGLRGVKMPNTHGRCRPAEELVLDGPGLDPSFVVDPKVGAWLRRDLPEVATVRSPATSDSVRRTSKADVKTGGVEVLEVYFEPWLRVLVRARELVGAFVALLGGDERTQGYADGLFGVRGTVDSFRERLDWSGRSHYLSDLAGADSEIRRWHFTFELVTSKKGETLEMTSLAGSLVAVPLATRFSHLLVKSPTVERAPERPTCVLSLRVLDPADYQDDLTALLTETARLILRAVYEEEPLNLRELFDEVGNSLQIDLEVAQAMILDHAFFYFRQLQTSKLEQVRELAAGYERLRRHELQRRNLKQSTKDIRAEIHSIQRKLREWFENDPEFTGECLAAVCAKIRDYQYRESSIPLELFQNADDAASELLEMTGAELPHPLLRKVAVHISDSAFTWMHWGRPINLYSYGKFSTAEGERRGFQADLEKMLTLSTSDKSSGEASVTGKFGLGFKSVYLFTDEPLVLSGALGFRVLGGMYPSGLEQAEAERLRGRLERSGARAGDGTVIELPATDSREPAALLAEFRGYVHVLLAFAHQIRECEVSTDAGPAEAWAWHERPLGSSGKVVIGEVDLPSGACPERFRALVLRAGGGGAILFSLGRRGVEALPNTMPTIWVTAPTDQKLELGFALNGQFQPDAGRAQLSHSFAVNQPIASEIGASFGAALVELFDLAENWDALRSELDFADGVHARTLWKGLWSFATSRPVVAANGNSAPSLQVVREALWARGNGFARLYSERAALPTGLSAGAYAETTRLDRVERATIGALDTAEVLKRVASNAEFDSLPEPGTVVSSGVAHSLVALGLWERCPRGIALAHLLAASIARDPNVCDERAKAFSSVLTDDLFEKLKASSDDSEFDDVLEELGKARFLAEDNAYHRARDLVVGHDEWGCVDEDERMRATFAPDRHVLAPVYDKESIELFKRARRSLSIGAAELAQWAMAADTPETRSAVSAYLLNGSLARPLARAIQESGKHSWLSDIREVLEAAGPDASAGFVVAGTLGLHEEFMKTKGALGGPTPPPPPPPRPRFEIIYEWWTNLRSESEREEYAARLYAYPGSLRALKGRYSRQPEERKAWLILFLRASLETLGRQTDDQHRRFLAILEREGWLDRLAREPIRAGALAIADLRAYLDRLNETFPYYRWMQIYLPLALLSEWVDAYAISFLSAANVSRKISLDHLLSPRTNPHLEGGGPDAPPIGATLGIGAHFVVRELVRLKIIENSFVHRYAYVPSARVCDFIAAVGGPTFDMTDSTRDRSKGIWDHVAGKLGPDRATFGGSFDLPFRVLAADADLCASLLDIDIGGDSSLGMEA